MPNLVIVFIKLVCIEIYRYLSVVKSKFGFEAQLLLEEILKYGYLTGSSAIIKVFKRVGKLCLGLFVLEIVVLLNAKRECWTEYVDTISQTTPSTAVWRKLRPICGFPNYPFSVLIMELKLHSVY